MCKWGKYKKVMVKIPADLSSTGKVKWKYAQIDTCIADIVKALQEGGIDMRGSCCGHENTVGDIDLQDGRMILILSKKEAQFYFTNRTLFYVKHLYKTLKGEIRWFPRYFWELLIRGEQVK